MIVKIKKLNENAVIPKFGKPGDGCQDVIAVSCKYNPKYDRFEYGLGFTLNLNQNIKQDFVLEAVILKQMLICLILLLV